ncbi:hypothetical protein [Frigidibacter sp. ROC022]|uniref:hypothetical protein n=1 Tax=Frigidibacter sp. ROC022 TaxID=2971796 RepID=UPI00215B5B51|nr:hypothetical protein [Frigidibacter sp. ROC022]MCR8724310.1 hypothetical protein [Frigidibacter sp. ROC022]
MAQPFRFPLWARMVIGLGVLVNLAAVTDLLPDSVERLWLQLVANAVILTLAIWWLARTALGRRNPPAPSSRP